MQAVRLHRDGLKVEEIEAPAPRPGEVLVRVHAAAITRGELEWPVDRLPAIPSYELSGVLVDSGDEVYALTPFDRDGVAAEYALVPVRVLAPKPARLSYVQAAALPMGGLTAWQALFVHGRLARGASQATTVNSSDNSSTCRRHRSTYVVCRQRRAGNRRHMTPRLAAACGLLSPLTYGTALLFGGLAQPDDFSSADDATSDLGATTASSPWIYNQIGMNLTGILIVVFALGLWRALSPDLLGRVGAVALMLAGVTLFLEGFLRLDCQGIDAGCDNTSWYSDGHRLTTALSGIFIFGSPLVLAFAFRRLPSWHNAWLPTLAAIPAFFLVSILFSLIGDGAATRAGALTWFLWLAFVAFQLLKKAEEHEPELHAAR